MADKDGNKVAKNYRTDVEFGRTGGFHVKGMEDVDWGMKSRLSKIFQPESGNTVMLAFDHGYFYGFYRRSGTSGSCNAAADSPC